MSSTVPILPALALYGLVAGLTFVLTRPSSGMRSVVLTLLIGVAMMAGLSFAINWVVDEIAYQASWYYYR